VLPLLVGAPEELDDIVSTYPLLNDKRYLKWVNGELDYLAYEISRLAILPHKVNREPRIEIAAPIAARLDKTQISLSISPVRSLETMQDVAFLMRPKGFGSLHLSQDTFRALSEPHRQHVSISYLHSVFSQSVPLLNGSDASVIFEFDSGLLGSGLATALVVALADAYNVKRSRIVVLVGENEIATALDQTKVAFDAFVKAGLRVGIADFGAGYSSLSYLRSLPISYLAVAGLFTAQIGSDKASAAVCD
jgi:EAL domain-containing protein (putative c-di-GMP-specific phosphodiesterase class I)